MSGADIVYIIIGSACLVSIGFALGLSADRNTPGSTAIADERWRQMEDEGFDEARDDGYNMEELTFAALHYALPSQELMQYQFGKLNPLLVSSPVLWPVDWDRCWDSKFKQPRIRQLVIAGALIAAEIDRRVRLGENPYDQR